MNLKCMINGIEYVNVIAQGAVFAEEFNETLDSGSIILTHVEKIENLLPYDDVFIYDETLSPDFSGFYRHLLVNNFSYERVNLSPYSDDKKIYFTYKIELFSETKGLETVQLPNISITQPKNFGNKKTKSVYYYLQQFVNMYSPKIKVKKIGSENEWIYQNKYRLSQNGELFTIFNNVYAPSFSLNSPNLRDVLAQLMLTKDMIPYVKDGEIYGMDITKRGSDFYGYDVYGDTIKKEILNIVGSRTSENHCDGLKRTYNDALSQENTCRTVEYIGFRNSSTSLMTLDNMRLETRFPIYKINKIYLCCYKKGTYSRAESQEETEHIFLCKHDITHLVKLNSERQLLSKNWLDFHQDKMPKTVEELGNYQMTTVGYDIGSRYITGWGEKYSYIKDDNTWYKFTNSYIQNIVTLMHHFKPLGIYTEKYIENFLGGGPNDNFTVNSDFFLAFVNPITGNYGQEAISSDILGLKGLFFEVEYEGFYNGTVIHSKDDAYENIIMNDNSSASLTLLEKDGLFQKEKVNRFSNEAITIRARHEKFEYLRPLGSVLNDKALGLEDVIIYHREYSIYDNFILATYYGTKDYVLKNYFTTVFSKHRPFNLLSYEESVRRSENKKMYLILSKNSLYYERENKIFDFSLSKVLSFYQGNPIVDKNSNFFLYPDKINYGYITINLKSEKKKFASDINAFCCGDSLCFNTVMYDNVSNGVYIQDIMPDANLIANIEDIKNDFSGSVQDWYLAVDDLNTGFLENIGFYFSHVDSRKYFNDEILDITYEALIKTDIYKKIFELPFIDDNDGSDGVVTTTIGSQFLINKDNKELIDMTYQIEPISKSNDVFFSPWMMKLSNLLSIYNKFHEQVEIDNVYTYSKKCFAYCTTILSGVVTYVDMNPIITSYFNYGPLILLKIPKSIFDNLIVNTNIKLSVSFDFDSPYGKPASYERDEFILRYSFEFNKIKHITKNNDNTPYSIHLTGTRTRTVADNWDRDEANWVRDESKDDTMMEFIKMDCLIKDSLLFNFKEIFNEEETEEVYYFANMQIDSTNRVNPPLNMNGFSNNMFDRGWHIWNRFNINPVVNIADVLASNSLQTQYAGDKSNYEKLDMMISENTGVLTYNKNMFMAFGIGESGKIEKHLIYDEYGRDEYNNELFPEYLELSELKLDEYIQYVANDGAPYLKITIPPSYVTFDKNGVPKYSSFQVWYFYEGSYKFVFGVNLSRTDIVNRYVKIYVSAISNKDPRVYKSTRGVLDGYVQNLLELDAPEYGTGQYYKKLKEQ